MRTMSVLSIGVALASWFLWVHPAAAVIEYSRLTRDDRSMVLLAKPFGFGESGRISISLKDMTIYMPQNHVNTSVSLQSFGFIMFEEDSADKLMQLVKHQTCPLEDEQMLIATFDCPDIKKVLSEEAPSAQLDVDTHNAGLVSVYFVNCASGMPVSFSARVEQYNLVGPHNRKDYLSIGETELDVTYWFMFALFSALAGFWACVLLKSPKECVQNIHWLMLALVSVKALTVFGQAVMYLVVERQGSPHGWNWVYYTFTGLRGLLFFTVVVLIGTGLTFMSSHAQLDERTQQTLMAVIPLQVVANLAIIVTSEESPAFSTWLSWNDLFHLVDIACCCAVLFPIMWSINRLREESEYDGKAARSLLRLQQIREFYFVVVAFMWFTRIGVFLLDGFVGWRYAWTVPAVNELAALAFYVVVGSKFRPAASNPYLRAPSQDGSHGQQGVQAAEAQKQKAAAGQLA